jgi:hypothetical protein
MSINDYTVFNSQEAEAGDQLARLCRARRFAAERLVRAG